VSVRQVYAESLEQAYDAKKRDLIEIGIDSRSKYTNSLLKQVAYEELQSRLKIRSFDSENVMIRDLYKGKEYDVRLSNENLYCLADQRGDCVHVFFASQEPRVRKALEAKGIKLI
jgi:hypothetical protein